MNRKEQILLLAEQLANGDVAVFFMQVFMWRFKKVGDVSNDYLLFIRLGLIPSYMEDFLNEVEKQNLSGKTDGSSKEEA